MTVDFHHNGAALRVNASHGAAHQRTLSFFKRLNNGAVHSLVYRLNDNVFSDLCGDSADCGGIDFKHCHVTGFVTAAYLLCFFKRNFRLRIFNRFDYIFLYADFYVLFFFVKNNFNVICGNVFVSFNRGGYRRLDFVKHIFFRNILFSFQVFKRAVKLFVRFHFFKTSVKPNQCLFWI